MDWNDKCTEQLYFTDRIHRLKNLDFKLCMNTGSSSEVGVQDLLISEEHLGKSVKKIIKENKNW